jgi:hypothetical protein
MEIEGDAESATDAEIGRARGRVAVAQAAARRARTGPAHETAALAVQASMLELYRLRPHVYELTGGTMATAQGVMKVYGMLDPVARQPAFPTFAEHGVTEWMVRAISKDGAYRAEIEAYRAAYAAVLERQVDNPAGIPLYKLVSPSGWLVTPDEISAALGAYRSGLDEFPVTGLWWWPAWIAFLERAEKTGLRVH